MNWYYANAGQQVGPISETDFVGLVREGTVKADTLVWHEGMANWEPYGRVAAASAAEAAGTGGVALPSATGATAGAAGTASSVATVESTGPSGAEATGGGFVCAECGRAFPPDEVIRYGTVAVCANCKPIFLQKLREGVAGGGPGRATKEQLIERDYSVPVGEYFSRSWQTFVSRPGTMIGVSLVVGLLFIVVNCIPYLSIITSLVLNGAIMGGVWLFFLKSTRGEDAGLGDAFGGFGPRFGQLFLANLVPSLIGALCVVPVAIAAAVLVPLLISRPGGQDFSSAMPFIMVVLGLLFLVGLAGFIYLTLSWIFTIPLVAEKKMGFWPAMELSRKIVRKHWWKTFWLSLVSGFFTVLGLLLCLIGVLVTGPVGMGMFAQHFQRTFGDLAPEAE